MQSILLICYFTLCIFHIAQAQPPKIPLQPKLNNTMYWGTYRPGIYFGMKARSSDAVETGMMVAASEQAHDQLFHQCRMEDKHARYGWFYHNGETFGAHELSNVDLNVQLLSYFSKLNHTSNTGGYWANRITGNHITAKKSEGLSLFYYVSVPDGGSLMLKGKNKKGVKEAIFNGKAPDIGHFSIVVKDSGIGKKNIVVVWPQHTKQSISKLPDLSRIHFYGLKMPKNEHWRIHDAVKKQLSIQKHKLFTMHTDYWEKRSKAEKRYLKPTHQPLIIPTLPNTIEPGSTIIVIQRLVRTPFEFDIAYVPHVQFSKNPKTKLSNAKVAEISEDMLFQNLNTMLADGKQEVLDKFDSIFKLKEKKITQVIQDFAVSALSNTIGSIGYFEGQSIISRGPELPPKVGEDSKLFSAVPSRSFFPRGFLWDEGFHQLLIANWNPSITVEVISHWFNLMDSNGWIAREQILGAEARSRVPREFVPQHPIHANPPSFFLTLKKLLTLAADDRDMLTFDESTHSTEEHVINKDSPDYLEFLSNLFPRLEKYIDWFERTQNGALENTFRWRGRLANHTLTSGLDDYPRAAEPNDDELHVDLLSWMTYSNKIMSEVATFIGQSDKAAHYSSRYSSLLSSLQNTHWNNKKRFYCDIAGNDMLTGKPVFASHLGYVSLFPLMLGLIPSDSPRLLYTLKHIQNENTLRSKYGIRSLSKKDKYFRTNENYWRSPIWINMNYLILQSLHTNYIDNGPYKATAAKVYKDLRKDLILNMYSNYHRTGYLWEQYDEQNGQGKGSHPFSGWSALIVNIIAETY